MKVGERLSRTSPLPTYAIVKLGLGRPAVITMLFRVITAERLKTISNLFNPIPYIHYPIFTYNILDCKITKHKKESMMRRRRRRVRRAIRMPGGFFRWIIIIVVVILLGFVCRMVIF
jgi:hypothetical protein